MRRFVVALLSIAAMGTAGANAADMPVKVAPIVSPQVFSWTGLYLGVHAGGSWSAAGDPDYSLTDPTGGAAFTSRTFSMCGTPAGVATPVPTSPNPYDLSTTCSEGSSFLGGGQIGYNWQSGAFVYGAEADISWRDLSDHHYGVFGANAAAGAPFGSVATDSVYMKSKQGALGTLRGRVGYAPGNWLIYVTGGLAVGHVEHAVTEVLAPGTTCITPSSPGAPTACRTVSDSETKVGWTIGAGVEMAFWQHWSIGVEYLYVDLGDTTLTMTPLATPGFFTNTSTTTFHDRSHIARVKLNYRF